MENKNATTTPATPPPITNPDHEENCNGGRLEFYPVDEPKTHTAAEFAAFRDAAVKIILTRTPEEAAKIFMGELDSIVAAAAEAAKPAAADDS